MIEKEGEVEVEIEIRKEIEKEEGKGKIIEEERIEIDKKEGKNYQILEIEEEAVRAQVDLAVVVQAVVAAQRVQEFLNDKNFY